MTIEVIKMTMVVTVPVTILACIVADKRAVQIKRLKIYGMVYLVALLIMFFTIHNLAEDAIEGLIIADKMPVKYSSGGGWSFNYDTVEMLLMGTMVFALIYFPFIAFYSFKKREGFIRKILLGFISVIYCAYIALVIIQAAIFPELSFIIITFGLVFIAIAGGYLRNVFNLKS